MLYSILISSLTSQVSVSQTTRHASICSIFLPIFSRVNLRCFAISLETTL